MISLNYEKEGVSWVGEKIFVKTERGAYISAKNLNECENSLISEKFSETPQWKFKGSEKYFQQIKGVWNIFHITGKHSKRVSRHIEKDSH